MWLRVDEDSYLSLDRGVCLTIQSNGKIKNPDNPYALVAMWQAVERISILRIGTKEECRVQLTRILSEYDEDILLMNETPEEVAEHSQLTAERVRHLKTMDTLRETREELKATGDENVILKEQIAVLQTVNSTLNDERDNLKATLDMERDHIKSMMGDADDRNAEAAKEAEEGDSDSDPSKISYPYTEKSVDRGPRKLQLTDHIRQTPEEARRAEAAEKELAGQLEQAERHSQYIGRELTRVRKQAKTLKSANEKLLETIEDMRENTEHDLREQIHSFLTMPYQTEYQTIGVKPDPADGKLRRPLGEFQYAVINWNECLRTWEDDGIVSSETVGHFISEIESLSVIVDSQLASKITALDTQLKETRSSRNEAEERVMDHAKQLVAKNDIIARLEAELNELRQVKSDAEDSE